MPGGVLGSGASWTAGPALTVKDPPPAPTYGTSRLPPSHWLLRTACTPLLARVLQTVAQVVPYTLPPVTGKLAYFAVRGVYRYTTGVGGTVSSCPSSPSFNDQDDLLFAVMPNFVS